MLNVFVIRVIFLTPDLNQLDLPVVMLQSLYPALELITLMFVIQSESAVELLSVVSYWDSSKIHINNYGELLYNLAWVIRYIIGYRLLKLHVIAVVISYSLFYL